MTIRFERGGGQKSKTSTTSETTAPLIRRFFSWWAEISGLGLGIGRGCGDLASAAPVEVARGYAGAPGALAARSEGGAWAMFALLKAGA